MVRLGLGVLRGGALGGYSGERPRGCSRGFPGGALRGAPRGRMQGPNSLADVWPFYHNGPFFYHSRAKSRFSVLRIIY